MEQVFTGHSGAVTCGQFTPDGRLVVTAGGENDCTIRVWDPKTGSCVHTTQGAHFHSVGELQSSCCLNCLRSWSASGLVIRADTSTRDHNTVYCRHHSLGDQRRLSDSADGCRGWICLPDQYTVWPPLRLAPWYDTASVTA